MSWTEPSGNMRSRSMQSRTSTAWSVSAGSAKSSPRRDEWLAPDFFSRFMPLWPGLWWERLGARMSIVAKRGR